MLTIQDINTIECDEEASEEDYFAAIQRAINAGVWAFQGSYGRTMMSAIESGHCLLGKNRARDYYGNTIPSRDDVLEGTKGSYDYVVEAMGLEWADQMASL
jgi:hypothetical protein